MLQLTEMQVKREEDDKAKPVKKDKAANPNLLLKHQQDIENQHLDFHI